MALSNAQINTYLSGLDYTNIGENDTDYYTTWCNLIYDLAKNIDDNNTQNKQVYIPLELSSFREIHEGVLFAITDDYLANPSINPSAADYDVAYFYDTVDNTCKISWYEGDTSSIIVSVPLPSYLDTTATTTLYIRASSEGTDTASFEVDYAIDEDTLTNETVTDTTANTTFVNLSTSINVVPPNPSQVTNGSLLTVKITPNTHNNDRLYINSIWVEGSKT